ncbi:MAG: hypothetical protein J3K34DRAFT_425375 [Monoraphidium minutum]|nr:MAG: hypothetical protein J3K34DRAFT_425375 [Monoraphidium minutum]
MGLRGAVGRRLAAPPRRRGRHAAPTPRGQQLAGTRLGWRFLPGALLGAPGIGPSASAHAAAARQPTTQLGAGAPGALEIRAPNMVYQCGRHPWPAWPGACPSAPGAAGDPSCGAWGVAPRRAGRRRATRRRPPLAQPRRASYGAGAPGSLATFRCGLSVSGESAIFSIHRHPWLPLLRQTPAARRRRAPSALREAAPPTQSACAPLHPYTDL